jgi:ABC-2 type transport system permease protein
MAKLWAIAGYEYRRHVLKRGFLLPLLIVPLLVAIVVGVPIVIDALRGESVEAVGYVDPSGTIGEALADEGAAGSSVRWVPFEQEAAAEDALAAGTIAAYYRLPADYPATRQVELVYAEEPGREAAAQLRDALRRQLLEGQRPETVQRIVAGSEVVVRLPDAVPGGPREFRGALTAGQFLPAASGLVLMLLTFISAGYLMGAVGDEKANRTMEILLTSASPAELMFGKVLGIVGITITQLVVWIVLSSLILVLGRGMGGAAWLQNLRPSGEALLIALAVAIPSYVMAAGLMAALGASVDEAQSSQQIAWVAITFYVMPLLFVVPMMRDLDAPAVVALSIAPFTAPVVLPLRAAFTIVPLWQILASVGVQLLGAIGALWLAARAVQMGALRYGRRLRWRELWGGASSLDVRRLPADDDRARGVEGTAGKRELGTARRGGGGVAKTLHILVYELRSILTKPVYVLTTLGIPILVFGQLWLMTAAVGEAPDAPASSSMPEEPAVAAVAEARGYVDQSGLIQELPAQIPGDVLVAYPDEQRARGALERGEIAGYVLIPADFVALGELIVVQPAYGVLSSDGALAAIEWALLLNLLDGNQALAAAVRDPVQVRPVAWEPGAAAGEGETASGEEDALMRLIPMLLMLLVYGSILMGSGLLLRSVSEEKKNRVIEILLTSVHPRQMMAGKVMGLGIAGMIQAAAWAVLGYLFYRLLGGPTALPANLDLSPAVLAWTLVYMVLGYAVYAALYAGAGALVPDWRKATSASLLIAVPALVGFEIGLFTTDNPHGLLAVLTSLFPLTAPMMMVKRLVVGGVPAWQPWAAAALMVLSLPLITRAVAHAFQAQYLLSGEPFSPRRYFRVLLGSNRP